MLKRGICRQVHEMCVQTSHSTNCADYSRCDQFRTPEVFSAICGNGVIREKVATRLATFSLPL